MHDLDLQSIVTTCAKSDNDPPVPQHQPSKPVVREQSDACSPWAIQMMKQFSALQVTTTSAFDELKSIVHDLKKTITSACSRVSRTEEMESKLVCLPSRVDELEKSASFISDAHDRFKQELECQYNEVRRIQQMTESINHRISNLGESYTRDQERSMKQNLLFFGIPESENENTDKVLQEFMEKRLPSVSHKLPLRLERSHRLGSKKSQTRPIVCRFSFFKDRELVRTSSKDLRGTEFSIKEQLPRVVLNRRRILHKKFQEARQNNKRATLFRDTLTIDGREFKVDQYDTIYETERTSRTGPRSQSNDHHK